VAAAMNRVWQLLGQDAILYAYIRTGHTLCIYKKKRHAGYSKYALHIDIQTNMHIDI
jgi:hypothetical protein